MDPLAPKKKRNKKVQENYGQILDFGAVRTNTLGHGQNFASGWAPVDQNTHSGPLSTPTWVPLPEFQVWEPSTLKKAGSRSIAHSSSQSSVRASPIDPLADPFPYFDAASDDFVMHHEFPESPMPMNDSRPPMLLELSFSSESDKSQELVGTGLREYENIHSAAEYENIHSAALPRNSWKDCKQKILKMLEDAHRSPLDFLLDLLDPDLNEYKTYRSK